MHFLTVLERPLEEEGRGRGRSRRAEKRAWRGEQRRGYGGGSREEGMEGGAKERVWRGEQRRGYGGGSREEGGGQGINRGSQDSHAFLPPYSLSQDFFGFVFSMKQTAFHALLARQHP